LGKPFLQNNSTLLNVKNCCSKGGKRPLGVRGSQPLRTHLAKKKDDHKKEMQPRKKVGKPCSKPVSTPLLGCNIPVLE